MPQGLPTWRGGARDAKTIWFVFFRVISWIVPLRSQQDDPRTFTNWHEMEFVGKVVW